MRQGWGAVAVALLLAACGGGSDSAAPGTTAPTPSSTTTTTAAPDGQWRPVDPEEAGFDAVALEALAAEAAEARSACLFVARDGRVVGEWYFGDAGPATAQEVYSVTKSITSVLVGIAADDGDLELDDPASTWIEPWRGTPAEAVTVRDVLANASGRHWDLGSDYLGLLAAEDRTAYGIGLAQDAPPGEVWAYNNAAIQTLEAVLEEATGDSVADFAEARLFGPLAMEDTRMTADDAGNALTFMGVRSTCRDLARFGQLVLQEGEWDGEQLVSRPSTSRRPPGAPPPS